MVVAIIQARVGSSRLPNKVMLEISEKPVLWHVVNRTSNSRKIDKIVVATSEDTGNDLIREYCAENGIECTSGSENDVLDRYYKALKNINIEDDDLVVRITADCPLIDPVVIDEVIERHIDTNSDYTSNCIEPTFPDGLDCEVFKASVLKQAWKGAKLKSEREHVTLYIRNHPEIFRIESYKGDKDLSNLRWTLDEEEDFQLIKEVYEELYNENKMFSTKNILSLLENKPSLISINSRYIRNEGLIKSLNEDGLIGQTEEEMNTNE
ncbi:MAG: cytidylyltransferase domain-containing protein [Eubacteriales bacterium]